MAWAKNTIRLETARSVFEGVEFTEIKIGEKVVGYAATWNAQRFESASLTDLCRDIWKWQVD